MSQADFNSPCTYTPQFIVIWAETRVLEEEGISCEKLPLLQVFSIVIFLVFRGIFLMNDYRKSPAYCGRYQPLAHGLGLFTKLSEQVIKSKPASNTPLNSCLYSCLSSCPHILSDEINNQAKTPFPLLTWIDQCFTTIRERSYQKYF